MTCHFLDILYVLTEIGMIGRVQKRDQGTDRKGKRKERDRERSVSCLRREHKKRSSRPLDHC